MPAISGISDFSVLDTPVRKGVDLRIIMRTRHGTVEMCRRAFMSGTAEFHEKTVDDEALLEALQNAVRQHVRAANATTLTANPATATPCYQNENAKYSASS